MKPGETVTVVSPNAAAVDAYDEEPTKEEPSKGAPNASAGAAAVHATASPTQNAAMTFRTRHHTADAEAKRCAGGAEERMCADSSDDDDVVSSSRRGARPARPPRASRADATRNTWDAPRRRRIARYLPNVAGATGTRVPTATRVPTFARLAVSVAGANERVTHGMCYEETRGVQSSARGASDAGRFIRGGRHKMC